MMIKIYKSACALLHTSSGVMALLALMLLTATSCGNATDNNNTAIIEDTTSLHNLAAPPDQAATFRDQAGVDNHPVPSDSLADKGRRHIGTSRPF